MSLGEIQIASKTESGEYKPSVMFIGDDKSYWLHFLEGIEGYHAALSEKLSENGKPKALYLNHGYFKIKPDFVVKTHQNTSDPMPKLDRNGCMSGVFQMKDARTGLECVMWCYTQPKEKALWERLRQQIEFTVRQLKQNGLNVVDKDGYLPVIFKIGKIPSRFGAKYAKVVSWDDDVAVIDIPTFEALDHPLSKETYENFPPRMANEFENTEGPLKLQG